MTLESGNSLSIVFTIYVAILLPWAFLYLHDFISDRWQTIKHTMMNGLLHLTVAVIPLPYIMYYIVLQASLQEPDYKEMFAAITAVVFNIYHILRTIWGLFQLYSFRQWAIRTAIIFESAAYPCAFNSSAAQSKRPPASRRSKFRHPRSRRTRALSPPECVPLDDPAEMEAGVAPSTPPPTAHAYPANDVHFQPQALANQRRRIAKHIDLMEVNSSIIDNEILNSHSPWRLSTSRIRPRHRRSTAVHWIVAYLAQFGAKWLQDCKSISIDPGETWKMQRCHFASRVWATAALRMITACRTQSQFGKLYHPADSMRSLLPPHILADISSNNKSQVFDKHEILRRCMLSGDALPFSCPLLDSNTQKLPSHGSYIPLIKESIESLPSRLYEFVEFLNPEQVEWFMVFIWVGDWGDCACIPSMSESDPQVAMKKTKKKKLSQYDTPVRVLQDQLGFDSPPTLDKCGFPIVKRDYGRNLWDNRTILEVSSRIDNWISLCNGIQVDQLLKREEELKGYMFERQTDPDVPLSSGPSILRSNVESDGPELELSEVFKHHRDLETRRLRYQLANSNSIHKHLEQGLTFMGCVMESVRSGIAEQFHYLSDLNTPLDARQKKFNGDNWTPNVPNSSVTFRITLELWQCLKQIEELSHPIDSTLEERLLWECQNGIHLSLAHQMKKSAGTQSMARTHETIEAMALCIMGFPSIQVIHRGRKYYEKRDPKSLAYYYLRAVGGPQQLDVSVRVLNDSADVAVSIAVNREANEAFDEPRFRWQDWRDAFEGRLTAYAVWQKTHFLRDVRMHHTLGPISDDVIVMDIGEKSDERRALFWGGWRPFRAGIPLFELKHSSLIIVGDKMPADIILSGGGDSSDSDERNGTLHEKRSLTLDQNADEAYESASVAALSDASLHLNALLKLNSTIFRSERDLRDGIEPEDPPATPTGSPPIPICFSPPPSPSSSSDGAFRLVFKQPPAPLQDTVLRAQEQDHIAMHHLAKWLLSGSNGFRKNRQKALLLMERALVLGRRVETAKLLLKALLEPSSGEVSEEDVQRALQAVELLWQDMPRRHQAGRVEWRGDGREESERMMTIVNLHEKLVKMRPRARMICALANQLVKWGKTREEEERAMLLYECAIIAGDNGRAMMELGRKYYERQRVFALALLSRAVAEGHTRALTYLE